MKYDVTFSCGHTGFRPLAGIMVLIEVFQQLAEACGVD